MSESTTGISQRKFLNSLTDDAVEQGFRRFLEINSRLSFAVVADLRLFVHGTLTELNVVNDNPTVSLLYCLTNFTAVLCDQEAAFAPSDLLANPFGTPWEVVVSIPWELLSGLDLSEMCHMLLDFGAHSPRSDPVTPFQALFFPRLPPQAQGCPSSPSSRNIARILLEHGQDPNETLSFERHLPGVPHCKPLHLSDRSLSALLLQHGATVNALDGSERTPLDMALSTGTSNPPQVFDKTHDVYEWIMLLLDHDGQITKHGEKCVQGCLEWLRAGQAHSASEGRVEKWYLHRLQRIPRITVDSQNKAAPPDQPPTSGRRRWKSRLPQATATTTSSSQSPVRAAEHHSFNRPVGTPRILMRAAQGAKPKAGATQQRSASLRVRA